MDTRTRRARVDGREVELTPKEFDLLAALAVQPGAVVSKQQLLEDVWGGTLVRRGEDRRRPRRLATP